ncbi:MAG: ATP-binding cassette domain-containing protein [Pseudomonadota bacterium]
MGLERQAALPASVLSYGQKKLLALAAALMPRPKLVVLDEPVARRQPDPDPRGRGGDPPPACRR